MNKKLSLFDLKAGDVGVVASFADVSNAVLRLQALGLVEGEPFRIVRFAPLGDPVQIKVKGFYLTVDKETGRSIGVRHLLQTGDQNAA